MNPNRSESVDPGATPGDEPRTDSGRRQPDGRFGRGAALKALGAALIGGVLGGGARPQISEAKRSAKKRQPTCKQQCPKKPKPTPTPPAGTKVMWATVDRGGQLARGSGVTSVKKTSEGANEVYFERDVEECAYAAQLPYFSAFGEVYPHPNAEEPKSVTVFTYDTSQNRIALNKDFHLIVTC